MLTYTGTDLLTSTGKVNVPFIRDVLWCLLISAPVEELAPNMKPFISLKNYVRLRCAAMNNFVDELVPVSASII